MSRLRRAIMAEGSDLAAEPSGDGWVMLLPLGAVNGRDGRRFKVVDARSVVALSRPGAGRAGQAPVDYEHQSEAPTAGPAGPKPAAGWIEDYEVRRDGIYARVNWTARAAELIANREYRFISPVFAHTAGGVVTRIVGAGLTHRPNLELRALSSEEDMTPTPEDMARIAEAAGLDHDATADEIVIAITELIEARPGTPATEEAEAANRASPDPAQFVP
ncbi:MAG: phage protease, partial [Litorimonas sp.]